MKILVIGGGFIASSIVQKLESEGHQLLVYSRSENPEIRCRQILGDIFHFEAFLKVFTWKPNIVIHTAWITTPGVYKDHYSNIRYAKFTSDLAQFIQNSEVEHLVILGTCAEYGFQNGPSTAGITKLEPNTLYAEQKTVGLRAAKSILQKSDVRLTWARVFYPYGPNQNQKRLIPFLIHSLKNRIPIKLADTTSIYDWITTRDISSAISWVIKNELPIEIDIATTFGFTNLDLLKILQGLMRIEGDASITNKHNFGLSEIYVAGKDSPLFVSGWSPMDSMNSGLEWVIKLHAKLKIGYSPLSQNLDAPGDRT